MKSNITALIIIVMTITGCAKRPDSNSKAINEACTLEMEAARTAVILRDNGKSKTDMLHTMPPVTQDSTRLLLQMHAIVEEAYSFTQLNEVIYATYRFAYCARQLQYLPVPQHLQEIYPDLLACQQQYDKQATKPATQCVFDAFPAEPGKPVPEKPEITL